ncbi:thioesterase [Micromonospora sp. HNM0581]|uniref:thioesterase II family protein n=1 Tax=Micromonospora sp. HNM0581 TaxID=2716341 RepID=UPI00146B1179|nr:alpha/beta fold hydrolase [Micromonospora sp. HNM0581]NLU80651.1 thioesterase [Micromonospora sp. HNM0581]
MSAPSTVSWFGLEADYPETGSRVFCLAHAGGNPRSLLAWQRLVDPSVRIIPVYLPGRAHRVDDPEPASLTALADAVAEAISGRADLPFQLFGHSFGALLAFEVARRLRHVPTLRTLVASGCSAPSRQPSDQVVRAAQVNGQEFATIVGSYGGLPPEILADEELHRLLFPTLKTDVRLISRYQYRSAPPLTVDLVLVNGHDDPHVNVESLAPWADEFVTTPEVRWSPGGHFYFTDRPAALVEVFQRLRTEPGRPSGVEDHVELI